MELSFLPSSSPQPVCGSVQLVNDSILENDESFIVVLSSSDHAAILDPITAIVNIINDDRKPLNSLAINRNVYSLTSQYDNLNTSCRSWSRICELSVQCRRGYSFFRSVC